MTEGSRSLANAQGAGKKSRPAEKKRVNRRDVEEIVDALRQSREGAHNIRHGGVARRVPSRMALAEVINGVSAALFPTHYGQPDLDAGSVDEFVRGKLKDSLGTLVEQVRLSLPLASSETQPEIESAGRVAQDIAQEFAAQLPDIRGQLADDLRAAYEGDPSAASMPEILLGYPGMVAIICYRLSRALHLLGAPLVARLITLVAHSRTGIDIHPGAEIGTGLLHRSWNRRGDWRDSHNRQACAAFAGGHAGCDALGGGHPRPRIEGGRAPSDSRRRCFCACRRYIAWPDHRSGRGIRDRRQCLAYPQRASWQQHRAAPVARPGLRRRVEVRLLGADHYHSPIIIPGGRRRFMMCSLETVIRIRRARSHSNRRSAYSRQMDPRAGSTPLSSSSPGSFARSNSCGRKPS